MNLIDNIMRFQLLLVILITLFSFPHVDAGEAQFYIVDINPLKVYPNEKTTLSITLKNLGDGPASYLRSILDPEDLTPITAIGPAKKSISNVDRAIRSSEYFGVIHQADKIFIEYSIHVDELANTTTYGIPLKLIWQNSSTQILDSTQTINIGLEVIGIPDLVIASVDTLPSRVYADSEFNISVTVENIGSGKAEAVELIIEIPPEFSGEQKGFLGTIQRDESSTENFNLKVHKKSISKSYEFILKIKYQDSFGKLKNVDKPFEIYVGEHGEIDIEIAGITTSPPTVYPGESFSLSMQLENIGKQDAKSVRAEINTPKEFIAEKTAFVGSLEKDDLSTAIFEIQVKKGANAQSYEMKMTVFYTDEKSIEHTDEKYFEIMVTKKPQNNVRTLMGAGVLTLIIGGIYFWRKSRVKPE